ncbi:MAG: M15 family metallopeptidase [Rickettsiaceae bacterium]|nr:M15 family metallopeptidase [Rickettsiaceae bacterium]MDP5020462.1 M15 family metallopeptidase [Rickettsiaceae bacterium]MDP5083094.1 M15 family metallopeptidase [Rickettsiaceae bacterium]
MNFSISDIPPLIAQDMMNKSIWHKDCPVEIKRLKLLTVSHYNFDHQISSGQIIVLDKISQSVLHIFQELLLLKFPIYSIKLMNDFNGSDELSMAANNSSCFNFRPIAGTKTLSMHSYGLAIDINPVQNPFIVIKDRFQKVIVHPKQATEFLNRHNQRSGMVEPIVGIFKKYGFSQWGGGWNNPIDYHHFQVSREEVAALIT